MTADREKEDYHQEDFPYSDHLSIFQLLLSIITAFAMFFTV